MRGVKAIEAVVAIAIILILLVLTLYFAPELEATAHKNNMSNVSNVSIIAPKSISSLQEFLATLEGAEELAIVENISGLDAGRARLVLQCGVGLAGSWGLSGKNISGLYIYVIDDEGCTFGSPLLNETMNRSISECTTEYERLPRFYITYGPSFSTFTSKTASIHIDESWKKNCGFVISE